MSEISFPKEWWSIEYGDALISASNGIGGKQNKAGIGIPVSRIETIANETINFERVGYLEAYDPDKILKHQLCKGDILFSHINSPAHLGKTALFDSDKELYHGINLLRLIVDHKLFVPRLFNYHCRLLRNLGIFSQNAQHAVNQSSLNQKKLFQFSAPLPPLAEQKVIADKLDTLLAQVENTKARLERIPQILKRFRQSVLAAAVSGRLTEEWREQNGIALGNTAELDEVIESSFYGPRFSKSDYTTDESGIPTVRTTDMKKGIISISSETPKVEVAREKLEQFKLISGDLLITRTGSIGVMALFEGDYIAIPSAYLIRFRLKTSVNKRFIYYSLTGPDAQQQMGLSSTAITQPNINAKSIRAIRVLLPAPEEQTEIVRRVDQLFAHADRIEQQVNNALARVNNLTQSILAKAFRGELTEQWRKDNPELISGENSAEALLDRIKAERAAQQPIKKTRAGKASH